MGLLPYTEYQVRIIGINGHGQPYNSSNVTALTEEGGKWSITLRTFKARVKVFFTARLNFQICCVFVINCAMLVKAIYPDEGW